MTRHSDEYRKAVQEVVAFPMVPHPTTKDLDDPNVEEVSFDAKGLQRSLDRMVEAKMKIPLTYNEALLLIVFEEMASDGIQSRLSDGP
jgi:hypothetical protein